MKEGIPKDTNPEEEPFSPEIPRLTRNIWELAPEEAAELKARIHENQGLVRIFVHPFFELFRHPDSYESPRYHLENPRVREIETVIQRILEKEPERPPPLLVLEEQVNMQQTSGFLDFLSKESGNRSYLVPTRDASPCPKLTPRGKTDRTPAEEAWTKLIERLKELGMERALVGGMYLVLEKAGQDPEWDKVFENYREDRAAQGAQETDYNPARCVGWTIGQLTKAGIKVEVSNLTHPHSRTDMLKREGLDRQRSE